jgi:hypothetical protein
MQVKININEYVKVKLKEQGFCIHRQHYDNLWVGRVPAFPYNPPEVDNLGYTEMPLWELMWLFGEHISLGMEVPFDTEIIFEKGEK